MLIRRRSILLLLLCAALWSAPASRAGAAEPGEVAIAIVNWIPNLAVDLIDIFKANISHGKGFGADLRLTRLLEAGYSDYDATRYGLNGGEGAVVEEQIKDGGLGIIGITIGKLERDPYEIGGTLHAMAGLELAANVRSALDFFTGIFFVDLEDDNVNIFE